MSRAMRRHHVERVAANRRPLDKTGMSDNELSIRHPLDCGSRCFLCHFEKLLGGGMRRRRDERRWRREESA